VVPKASAFLGLGEPMGAEQLGRVDAEGDAALGVGLGRFAEQGLAGDANDGASDQDLALVQVDLRPAQPARLAPAGAQDHGQAQEQPQLGVLGRRGPQQPGGVLDGRRLGVGLLARGFCWGFGRPAGLEPATYGLLRFAG
jgi:hypothetical protein